MRLRFLLLPMLACASPGLAQTAAQPSPQLPREFTNPATAEKLANAMEVLSKAFLDLPVGEVQAALEGRKPTPSEKKLTVRDVGRRDNPDFERELSQRPRFL